jgi:acyl transferase domain-containing protein
MAPTRGVVFVFGGHIDHYRQIVPASVVRDADLGRALRRYDEMIVQAGGERVLPHVFLDSGPATWSATDHGRIFAAQHAVADLLIRRGVRPMSVLGAGVGEFAAASVSGLLAPHDAVRCLIAHAGALHRRCPPGGMLAVRTGEEHLRADPELCAGTELAFAGEDHVVLSGPVTRLELAERGLLRGGVVSVRLPVRYGLHSGAIGAAARWYLAATRQVVTGQPQLLYVSATATACGGGLDRVHLWHALRRPVRLVEAAEELRAHGGSRFVDLGPGTVVTSLLRRAGFDAVSGFQLAASLTGTAARYPQEPRPPARALVRAVTPDPGLVRRVDWSAAWPAMTVQ